MATETSAETFRPVIAAAFPDLAGAALRLLPPGWHSTAVEADGRIVLKFPRGEAAERALAREAGLLAGVRPAVTVRVPDLTLHPGPPLFSRHPKIEGEHLLPEQYQRLPDHARQRLAEDLALFFAELHALDPGTMAAAGAGPVEPWLPAETILARALPLLPADLRALAERTVRDWRDLPPDPHGTVYGFFDGHGWNMAFDHARGRLNGIYDFADSGLGPLHREFVYPSLTAPDLAARIVAAYEALTGRALDRRRIALLTGAHRLWELAAAADDPAHIPAMARNVADWAAAMGQAAPRRPEP